jgi:hypothetical protein
MVGLVKKTHFFFILSGTIIVLFNMKIFLIYILYLFYDLVIK